MSDDSEVVEYSVAGLDKLIRSLNAKLPVAKVGIIGPNNVRDGKSPSNATIGAAHEFGTSKLPIRSFLRTPITEMLQKEMEKAGALSDSELKSVIATGSVVPWLTKVAILAQDIVLGAFDSGGYGKWKPSNMENKQNHQTLVETKQLRESISYEVEE